MDLSALLICNKSPGQSVLESAAATQFFASKLFTQRDVFSVRKVFSNFPNQSKNGSKSYGLRNQFMKFILMASLEYDISCQPPVCMIVNLFNSVVWDSVLASIPIHIHKRDFTFPREFVFRNSI